MINARSSMAFTASCLVRAAPGRAPSVEPHRELSVRYSGHSFPKRGNRPLSINHLRGKGGDFSLTQGRMFPGFHTEAATRKAGEHKQDSANRCPSHCPRMAIPPSWVDRPQQCRSRSAAVRRACRGGVGIHAQRWSLEAARRQAGRRHQRIWRRLVVPRRIRRRVWRR
jgi:hypothetical protein